MAAIAWTTIQNALHAFVTACSGLAADHVRWSDASAPRPAGTYINLAIPVIADVGSWTQDISDGVGGGLEIARGHRRCELQIQCIGGTVAGSGHVRAILEDTVSRATFDGLLAPLRTAGIGWIGFESIATVESVAQVVTFEPRAIVVGAFFVASEISRVLGTIESVEFTNTITGTTRILP